MHLQQEDAVREPRQSVVKRGLASLVGGRLEVGARLGVEQVRGGDVRQRLGRVHDLRKTAPGCRDRDRAPRAASALWQSGNVNTAAMPALHRLGGELRKPALGPQIRHRHRLAALVGGHTRTFAESVCNFSKRKASPLDAATYRGWASGAISVTPAA